MKLALAALAVACLSSFGGAAAAAANSAVRGANDDDAGPAVRMLQDDVIGEDYYHKKYETGSCACAKDAYLAVYKEAGAHLKMVPLVLSDKPNPEKNSIYPKIEREINRLLDFAVCFLHSIDCGCDDAPYGKLPAKIFGGKFKVSTYQCCCDVNAIRDIIINGIKELSQWQTTMGMVPDDAGGLMMGTVVDQTLVHKREKYHVLENIVQNVYKNVREIGEIYVEHDESCLEAICATDDSLFQPDLNPLRGDMDRYACTFEDVGHVQEEGYEPIATPVVTTLPPVINGCVRICDLWGKSQCVQQNGYDTCSKDTPCTNPTSVCLPTATSDEAKGECFTPCP